MAPEDTDRLYGMLAELRDSVEGYRADLNGRLRYLEVAEAERRGMDAGGARIGRVIIGASAIAAATAAVISFALNLA